MGGRYALFSPHLHLCFPCSPQFVQSWILTESLSHTIIASYSLMTAYPLLRSHSPYFPPWLMPNPRTLSAPMCHAPSSFDFYEVWKGKRHWRMSNVSFERFFEGGGRAEDVDGFARSLLVTFMGVDEARTWYRDTSGTFKLVMTRSWWLLQNCRCVRSPRLLRCISQLLTSVF